MKLSLSKLLFALWLAFLAVCLALALLMGGMYRLGIDAQVSHIRTEVNRSVLLLQQRFGVYLSSFDKPPATFADSQRQRELNLILGLVLADHHGVEGGFWTTDGGFTAYAFPTYEGAVKTDVPEAEKGRLTHLVQEAAKDHEDKTRQYDSRSESLIMSARPSGVDGLVIWTMARAHVEEAAAHDKLMTGFLALFGFAVVSGSALLWFLHRWSDRVGALVADIEKVPMDALPELKETGLHELDSLVSALNRLNVRYQESRNEMNLLTGKLARAERMTALGRMAASVAHEVRNPVAAIRLKAENALEKTDEHRRAALLFSLQEIRRLDDLLERLLAMARLDIPHPQPTELKPWAQEQVESIAEKIREHEITLTTEIDANTFVLDGKLLGRAVHNLLVNALQHTPRGGWIKLSVHQRDSLLLVSVEDSGPGVQESRREAIFEPFITSRSDGSGLGLNIARQLVESHGGIIRCMAGNAGARFEIELPCPKS